VVEALKKRDRAPDSDDLDNPKLYINRELSLLEYHRRVLAQASDGRHPLLDRIKFLAHASEGLDEFFMVRVSDLQDQIDAGLVELARTTTLYPLVSLLPRLGTQIMKLLFEFRGEMHFPEFEIREEHRRCQVPSSAACCEGRQEFVSAHEDALLFAVRTAVARLITRHRPSEPIFAGHSGQTSRIVRRH